MVSSRKQLARSTTTKSRVPPHCPNKDLFHRINFTYQASIFLQALDPSPAKVELVTDQKGKRKAVEEESRDEPDSGKLARAGIKSERKMATHTLLKLYVLSSLIREEELIFSATPR